MYTKRFALGLSAIALVGAAGLALAATTTNTPGAACVASAGTLAPNANGAIQNSSAASATATCPADRVLAPTQAMTFSAVVWVVDQSTASNVCCNLAIRNPLGSPNQTGTPKCTTGKSSGVQALSLDTKLTDTATFSHWFVSCTLPAAEAGAASQVLTYRTIEE